MNNRNNEVIVLGSYKPDNWMNMVEAMNRYENIGKKILSPRGKVLIDFPLEDNQDFYYLEEDLKLAGLKESDLKGKNTAEIIDKLDLRELQRRVCNLLKNRPLVHAVINDGKLGKSTSCELSLASVYGCDVILSQKITTISSDTPPIIFEFIGNKYVGKSKYRTSLISFEVGEKEKIIEAAENLLLRPKFSVCERPKDEWGTTVKR